MSFNNLWKSFDNGILALNGKTICLLDEPWADHPAFPGVRLKTIVSGKQSGNLFSYHLVQIDPLKKIGLHVHEKQVETHEVISGEGSLLYNGTEIDYRPGAVSYLEKNTEHEVRASDQGLLLFAKFFPAS